MSQLFLHLSPPSNWQDFQLLIAEIARIKYVDQSVLEYGRQGQRQHGVDVYAVDFSDRNIGIQCKETKTAGLTKTIIDKEIAQAAKFSPALHLFIIATTARADVHLHDHINGLNDAKSVPFRLQLWFWEDLNREINRSQSVMSSYYNSIYEQFGLDEIRYHLSKLKLGFDRPAFTDDFLYERSYEDFETTLVHMKAMLKTGFLYDRWTKTLIAQIVPSESIGDTKYRDFIQKIEKLLDSIYRTYQKDKKEAFKNPRHLEERAGEYNILRRKLINTINTQLNHHGLEEISLPY